MTENYETSLKSLETDDWLDIKLVRPLAYWWAVLFARMGIHPNTITIISIFIGAGSSLFFAHGSYYYEGLRGLIYNLVAISLLVIADILDCVDGQLARITKKSSPLGRILDGAAGFAWFVPIYVFLAYRFYCYHDIEFGWLGIENTPENTCIATCLVYLFVGFSGFVCLAGQSRVADYYIQVHLFFLKGREGSEFDNSKQQEEQYREIPWKGNYLTKIFLKNYVSYTRRQEQTTPQFQKLLSLLKEKYGSATNAPKEFVEEFHSHSLEIMKYNGLLTFNFRTSFLILFCLLDIPLLFFVFEVVGMSLLCRYIIHRHESFCTKMIKDWEKG
ncbi:MAG TPA: CDP-alcohol phosphatidyltransferase [Porphyromonadaceae bacterium]|nr:CDP-alcohol phosphatidyltransferase [Porphyromonadaceae bacterium]